MISSNNQRVAVLIDTANLYHTAKIVYHSKVHFESLIHTVVGNRSLARAIAYTITSDNATETSFLETLTDSGIEVKTKPLITYRNGNQKADWDVGITVDAVALASHIDVLVLVSGDGDFVPLGIYLQSRGVRFEVAAFDQSVSQILVESSQVFHNLSEITDTILINRNSPISNRTSTQSHGNNIQINRLSNEKTENRSIVSRQNADKNPTSQTPISNDNQKNKPRTTGRNRANSRQKGADKKGDS